MRTPPEDLLDRVPRGCPLRRSMEIWISWRSPGVEEKLYLLGAGSPPGIFLFGWLFACHRVSSFMLPAVLSIAFLGILDPSQVFGLVSSHPLTQLSPSFPVSPRIVVSPSPRVTCFSFPCPPSVGRAVQLLGGSSSHCVLSPSTLLLSPVEAPLSRDN